MGKGDRRTRRGKIWAGTNGKSRPKKHKQKHKPREGAFMSRRLRRG